MTRRTSEKVRITAEDRIIRGEAGGVVDLRDVVLPEHPIGALLDLPPKESPTLEARLRARRALEAMNVWVVYP